MVWEGSRLRALWLKGFWWGLAGFRALVGFRG